MSTSTNNSSIEARIEARILESIDASIKESDASALNSRMQERIQERIQESIDESIGESTEDTISYLREQIKQLREQIKQLHDWGLDLQDECDMLRKTNETLLKKIKTSKTPKTHSDKPKKVFKPNPYRGIAVPKHIAPLVFGKKWSVMKAICDAERKEASKHGFPTWCKVELNGERYDPEHGDVVLLKVEAKAPQVLDNLVKRIAIRIEQSIDYNARSVASTFRGYA